MKKANLTSHLYTETAKTGGKIQWEIIIEKVIRFYSILISMYDRKKICFTFILFPGQDTCYKVYPYPTIIFSYVKERHFSSPLHQYSEKGVNK